MRIFKVFLFLLCSGSSLAQSTDYHWLFGYNNDLDPIDTTFGVTHIDFNNDIFQVYSNNQVSMNFDACNTSVCDENGNLIFYTNCIDVFNGGNEILDGSIGFNDFPFHVGYEDSGLPLVQGIVALKDFFENKYYLFHLKLDVEEFDNDFHVVSPAKLLYNKLIEPIKA